MNLASLYPASDPVRIRSAAVAPLPSLRDQHHSLVARGTLARWLARYPNGAVWSWAISERLRPAVRR